MHVTVAEDVIGTEGTKHVSERAMQTLVAIGNDDQFLPPVETRFE